MFLKFSRWCFHTEHCFDCLLACLIYFVVFYSAYKSYNVWRRIQKQVWKFAKSNSFFLKYNFLVFIVFRNVRIIETKRKIYIQVAIYNYGKGFIGVSATNHFWVTSTNNNSLQPTVYGISKANTVTKLQPLHECRLAS